MGPVVEADGDDLAGDDGREQAAAFERRLTGDRRTGLPRRPVEELDRVAGEAAVPLVAGDGDAPAGAGWRRRGSHSSPPRSMPNSIESTRASQLASMMFSLTPMLPQLSSPSLASSSTRVTAPVPLVSSRMRTL